MHHYWEWASVGSCFALLRHESLFSKVYHIETRDLVNLISSCFVTLSGIFLHYRAVLSAHSFFHIQKIDGTFDSTDLYPLCCCGLCILDFFMD